MDGWGLALLAMKEVDILDHGGISFSPNKTTYMAITSIFGAVILFLLTRFYKDMTPEYQEAIQQSISHQPNLKTMQNNSSELSFSNKQSQDREKKKAFLDHSHHLQKHTQSKSQKRDNLCSDGHNDYCTFPKYYPQAMVTRALKRLQKSATWPTTEEQRIIDIIDNTKEKLKHKTENMEYENVCGSVKTTITPRVATNSKQQQRYLVHSSLQGLTQTVNTVRSVSHIMMN